MLLGLERFIRQLSWLPGLAWLDTWLASMHSQAGQYDQIKGDMEVRAEQMANVATDPLGNKGYEDTEEGEEASAEEGGDTKKGKKSKKKAAAQTGSASGSQKSSLPPEYRAQQVATRASCMMFVFLFVLVGVVWAIFFFDPKNVPWRHSMSWWRIAAQVVLVFAIPVVLNRIIRIWLEGARSSYPDIQYAWDYGLRACQVAGVAIDSVPLYLIIGSESEHLETAVHAAAKMEYRAAGLPVGPAALHWYVTPEAIYLYASEVGWTSSLATPLEAGEDSPNAELPHARLSDGIADAASASGREHEAAGLQTADRWENTSGFRVPDGTGFVSQADDEAPSLERTLVTGTVGSAAPASETTSSVMKTSQEAARSLDSAESTLQLARLRYLCRLIRNIRSPLSPLNGIMTMVPHHLIDGTDDTISETQKAVSADLEVIQEVTQLRCPVTTLVTGMEKESGFREFIRRVGPKRALWQRFGKKFDLTTKRTEGELQSFNVHLVGSFEDWIYTLFREKDALTKPGNTGLYELLGDVRCSWKSKLERLLTQVFANPSNQPLFSGCYFAATGATPDRQAFVRAVFDKLAQEQELLEWTERATKEDWRVRVLATLGYVFALGGALAFAYRAGHLAGYW